MALLRKEIVRRKLFVFGPDAPGWPEQVVVIDRSELVSAGHSTHMTIYESSCRTSLVFDVVTQESESRHSMLIPRLAGDAWTARFKSRTSYACRNASASWHLSNLLSTDGCAAQTVAYTPITSRLVLLDTTLKFAQHHFDLRRAT